MIDEEILIDYRNKITKVNDLQDIESINSKLFGKLGIFTKYFLELKSLPYEQKKILGNKLNNLKRKFLTIIANKKFELEQIEANDDGIDLTIPSVKREKGSIHPINSVLWEIFTILNVFGFSIIEGNSIENDWYNFSALRFKENHPAREMHDTFFLQNGMMLRTHTSNMQIRIMEKTSPPFYFISPGCVYRNDSIDMYHFPMFHQLECVVVDKGINMGHLKYIVEQLIKMFFEKKIISMRFRPSFFPFTEPSAEVDMQLNNTWIELMGCGMIHPEVLENVGINSKQWSGIAFGLGVERFAMLKYNIKDLRQFFYCDKRWLDDYRFSAFNIPTLLGGLSK